MKIANAEACPAKDASREEADWRIERAELLWRRAELARQNHDLAEQVAVLTRRVQELQRENDWLLGTRSWKLTRPLRSASLVTRKVRTLQSWSTGLMQRVKDGGLRAGLEFARKDEVDSAVTDPQVESHRAALDSILARYPDRPMVVHRPLIDWDVPLFQRPQHIARALGRLGILYFYCTPNWRDAVSGFREMGEGCFVTDQFEMLLGISRPKVVHLYSTDPHLGVRELVSLQRRGLPLLYEYVDEIHPDVAGAAITETVRDRHELLRRDESVLLVATADKLLNEVASFRTKNVALVTNGVDLPHFAARDERAVPPELERLLGKGRPIVGYYGALARWFDYDLVKALASARPEYEFLLIGPRYDASLDSAGLEAHGNVTVLGAVDYRELPRYARHFDVATVPFVLNEVTESTSPIKLFEYMALGHPIVTTDMRECRKYESVLIGRDANEFARQLDRALELRADPAYRSLLAREAALNTWDAKATEMVDLLRTAFPDVFSASPADTGGVRSR